MSRTRRRLAPPAEQGLQRFDVGVGPPSGRQSGGRHFQQLAHLNELVNADRFAHRHETQTGLEETLHLLGLGFITKVPPCTPRRVVMRFCDDNTQSASRMVLRLTPNRAGSSDSTGRRSPAGSHPG